MMKSTALACAMALAAPAMAQTDSPAEIAASDPASLTLPGNTEVILRMNDDLTTKGGQVKEGHMFRLTVAYDVKVGGVTVIPAGTPATAEVTMRTGKAVFGKSGKMEVEMRSVDLDGLRIPVSGKYRQEGEGNTLAAVGAVLLSAPLLFVTGKSAVIPRGRELSAYTTSAMQLKAR